MDTGIRAIRVGGIKKKMAGEKSDTGEESEVKLYSAE